MSDVATLVSATAFEVFLDRVKGRDAFERFAGDRRGTGGGEHWAIIASLVETCKLSGVDPQAYLEDTLTKIVNGHLNTEIDELLPWSYAAPAALKDVA